MTRLISSCCADRPRGSLATSTSSTSAGQLAEQLARGQPVGDHDVGLHQRLAPGDRHQVGVAGPAADQDHPGSALVAGAMVGPRAGPRGSRRAPPPTGAARGWPARPPSPRRAARPPGSRRSPRVASSARTQKMRRASAAASDRPVDLVVVGGRDDVPRIVEVAGLEAPLLPGHLAPTRPSRAGVTSGRRRRTSAPAAISAGPAAGRRVPRRRPARRRPAEAQPGGVRREVVHPVMIGERRRWSVGLTHRLSVHRGPTRRLH